MVIIIDNNLHNFSMKKTSILFTTLALTALFTMAGFVHAQTEATQAPAGSAPAVNSTGDTRGPGGPDKPGSVRPGPSMIDYKPMSKDPAVQKKLMEAENQFKKVRATCVNLGTTAAKNDCVKKAEIEFGKNQAEVKANYKISDEDMKRKIEEDRPKTDDQRKEDRLENRVMNIQTRVENAVKELTALYTRFTEIGDRIDARIKTLATTKMNTDAAQKFMKAARADLAKAKTEIDALVAAAKTEVPAATASTDATATTNTTATTKTAPGKPAILTQVQAHMKAAKEALISAHKNLTEAARNLKPDREDPDFKLPANYKKGSPNLVKPGIEETKAPVQAVQ